MDVIRTETLPTLVVRGLNLHVQVRKPAAEAAGYIAPVAARWPKAEDWAPQGDSGLRRAPGGERLGRAGSTAPTACRTCLSVS
jgi:hypothetical protein